jgi:hypothetical protein
MAMDSVGKLPEEKKTAAKSSDAVRMAKEIERRGLS